VGEGDDQHDLFVNEVHEPEAPYEDLPNPRSRELGYEPPSFRENAERERRILYRAKEAISGSERMLREELDCTREV